jgi:hypothetical protein
LTLAGTSAGSSDTTGVLYVDRSLTGYTVGTSTTAGEVVVWSEGQTGLSTYGPYDGWAYGPYPGSAYTAGTVSTYRSTIGV